MSTKSEKLESWPSQASHC